MIHTEIAVLGSCLVDRFALEYSLENLTEEFFQEIYSKKTFALFDKAKKDGIPIDPITICGLTSDEDHRKFILECAEQVPSALTIRHYVDVLKKDFYRSRMALLFHEASKNPEDQEIKKEIDKVIDQMQESKTAIKTLKDGLVEYLDLIEKRSKGELNSIESGYSFLDKITGGFLPGDFVVIGGRPSRGKSASLINLAKRYFERGERVLYVSSEMVYSQIMDRIMSIKTKIPGMKIKWGPSSEEVKKITQAAAEISEKDFMVYEGGFLNLPKISNLINSYKPSVLIVDYIQGFIPQARKETRAAFYSEIAYTLKAIANEKKILVLSASQFGREVEKADREPTLADFKESGGIEEAADVAILLHQKEDDLKGTRMFDFIIAKNRNGPIGRIPFIFMDKFTQFEEEFRDS